MKNKKIKKSKINQQLATGGFSSTKLRLNVSSLRKIQKKAQNTSFRVKRLFLFVNVYLYQQTKIS